MKTSENYFNVYVISVQTANETKETPMLSSFSTTTINGIRTTFYLTRIQFDQTTKTTPKNEDNIANQTTSKSWINGYSTTNLKATENTNWKGENSIKHYKLT